MSRKNQHIHVFVRCRPPTASEKKSCTAPVVEVKPDRKEVIVKDRLCSDRNKAFSFDHVFPGTAKQIEVYQAVMAPIINEVLLGYNCTVFAYGQTGTGKTYTMEGERSNTNLSWDQDPSAGIIPRTLHQLFETLQGLDIEFTIRVSFLELYNEELFDLLSAHEDTAKLKIFEDSTKKGSVIIQGLEEITVHSREEVFFILEKGAAKRQTAATLMNATSSRSHTVFSITVHIRENTDDGEELLKTGKLNLVDLAGSENIGRSGAIDRRAREAGNINQSLLTLGRVITALVDKAPHVPYRESKLTRLLQDSLGGRTKTSIIATISPALINVEETLSTLDYAHRAKNITNRPEVNQKMTKRALIKEYTEEIERLRRDLVASREKNGIFIDEENYRGMELKLNAQSQEIVDKTDELNALTEKLQALSNLFKSTKKEAEEKTVLLNKTSQDLDVTKNVLQTTKVALQRTEIERDEQQHLVKVHSETEVALSQTASTLVAVATTTTKDISLLQNKLFKKSEIDNANKSHLSMLGDELEEELTGTREQLGARAERQKETLQDVVGSIRGLQESIQDQWTAVQAFVSESESRVAEVVSLHNGVCKDGRKEAEDAFARMASARNDYLAQNQAAVQKTKALITSKVNDTQGDLQHFFKDFCESLVRQVTETCGRLAQTLTRYSESQAELWATTHEKMETTEAALSLETRTCEKLASELRKGLQESEQQLNTVFMHMCSMMEDRRKTTGMITEQLQQVADRSSKATELTSQLTCVRSSQQEAQASIENTLASDSLSICKEIEAVVKDHTTELQQSLASTVVALASLEEGSRNELDNLVQAMATQAESSAEATNHFLAENEACTDKLGALLETCQQQSKLAHDSLLTRTETRINVMRAECCRATEQVHSVSALVEAADEEAARNVTKCKDLLASLEKGILEYEPTGFTPQRKDYPFPMELPCTSPDEVILNRMRAARERISPVPFAVSDGSQPEEQSTMDGRISASSSTESLASSVEGATKENARTKRKAKLHSRPKAMDRRVLTTLY